ncbi:fructosamine kinase family protein [Kozakia baliensis]|uniref:fructosamine kinase family protein n=1 Tax=Kozakia baliensis TaxID=153496 RepID=UPI00345C1F76
MSGSSHSMTSMARHAVMLLGGGVITEIAPLSGGDISELWRVGLEDNRRFVIKTGSTPIIEADMLRALQKAGAPTPKVLAADAQLLVMEFLPHHDALSSCWADLGRVLRRLHDHPQPARYGWEKDFSFGELAIPNGWHDDWAIFWRNCRLLVHLSYLPANLARRLEKLASTLPDRLPRKPLPALLHGDLWSGNVLAESGRITGLIDPACCVGDASAEFAMLTLFARPNRDFWESYGGPPAGYGETIFIYRLWPALVHFRLFGGSYHAMVSALLDNLGV